jgi:Uma2 family endonuclease
MISQTLPPPASRRATLDDLMKVEGKAELIGGRIVRYMAVGLEPNRIAGRIYRGLDDYAEARGGGIVGTDGLGYAVPELPSGRESFSPDASYYDGPLPANEMDFIPGPPTFAAEVRSKNDYGPAVEREMAAKRADYFLSGTKVVWDVDPVAECIRVYRADDPDQPTIRRKGEQVDAEPAVPGWRMPVDRILG